MTTVTDGETPPLCEPPLDPTVRERYLRRLAQRIAVGNQPRVGSIMILLDVCGVPEHAVRVRADDLIDAWALTRSRGWQR